MKDFSKIWSRKSLLEAIPTTADDGGGAEYIWLGASDQVNEGVWIWENGSQMSFSNWGSGAFGSEPDNYNNQDGLALGLENWPAGLRMVPVGNAGFWNDVDVNNELFFVMQTANIPSQRHWKTNRLSQIVYRQRLKQV